MKVVGHIFDSDKPMGSSETGLAVWKWWFKFLSRAMIEKFP